MFLFSLFFSFLAPFPPFLQQQFLSLVTLSISVSTARSIRGQGGKKNIEMDLDISDISIISDISDLDCFEWSEWSESSERSSLVSILISGPKPPALTCEL